MTKGQDLPAHVDTKGQRLSCPSPKWISEPHPKSQFLNKRVSHARTFFLASFGITKAPRTEGWDFSTEPTKPQGGLGSQQMEAASHRQRAGQDPRGAQ